MAAGKQRIFLLVVLFFGVPAIVTLGLLTSGTKLELGDGAQPGGVVRGRVQAPGGAPAADLDVAALQVSGNALGSEVARARTDASGAFELALPPLEGRYVLRVTGATFQERLVEHGWVDRSGARVEPPSPTIEMLPGSSLDVEIVGADGRPAGNGRWQLTGQVSRGLFGGFSPGRIQRAGTIDGGRFAVRGLPPMNARLLVELEKGVRIDSLLELAEGPNRHRIDL